MWKCGYRYLSCEKLHKICQLVPTLQIREQLVNICLFSAVSCSFQCAHTFSMDIELRNDRIPRNPFDRQFLDMLRSKHLPHHAFRAHFFTERVIPIWNHLPHDVVTSLNITVFRTRLRSVDLSPFCTLYPFHV